MKILSKVHVIKLMKLLHSYIHTQTSMTICKITAYLLLITWQNVTIIFFCLAVLGQWSPVPCTYAGGGKGEK